jgi:ADP-ribose pyrophosphatase YjhB (NUDIX family)
MDIDIDDPNKYIDKKLYCINCGKNGHVSKKCLCPIISVGIICIKLDFIDFNLNNIISYSKKIQNKYLFTSDEIYKLNKLKKIFDSLDYDNFDKYIKYLLIRRRNSLNYVEFIRGKYDINNIDYLGKSLNFITNDERNALKTRDFNSLWNDLWGNNTSNNEEYLESLNKFNLLKRGLYIKKNEINIYVSLDKLINDCIFNYDFPEWGFPKGRRNSKEKNIECAKREFEEETTIDANLFNIINISPLEETYIASNNLKYKHIYYSAEIKNKNLELKIDKNNINQNIEIGDINWFSFYESLSIIRDYNIEKKNILINLHLSVKYIFENFKNILDNYLENNSN